MKPKKTRLKHDGKKKWAIVDSEGKIVDKFRTYCCARGYIRHIRLNRYDKFTVRFVE